ncbi:MAG: hypothetical protein J2P28_14640 [Actinobacteria bacterium]|nr:hypothetical protein [Actinomycetota bacterium]MBO0836727.1 hypothetical protein [Actinomycetota bacterium]
MEQGNLQGWQADPFGQHEKRYFSDGKPTSLVRDGAVESRDEPPGGDSPGVPAEAAGAAEAADAAAAADATASEPSQDQDLAGLGAVITRPRSRLTYAIVAGIAVIGVLAGVALSGGLSSGKTDVSTWNGTGNSGANISAPGSDAEVASLGMAPTAFVTTAATHTLARNTAAVSLSASMAVAGHMVLMHGTGQVDLAHNAVSLSISGSYPGRSIGETAVLTGGKFYLQVSANGRAVTLANGHKHWMEVPIAQSGAQNLTSTGPVSLLRLLESQASRVSALGTKQIGGLKCSGFAVTPTRQAVIAEAQREWARLGLTKAQRSVALQVIRSSTPAPVTIWFDSKRQLACQVDVQMQVSNPNATGTTGMQMTMTFARYGMPVNIKAPAISDTVLF